VEAKAGKVRVAEIEGRRKKRSRKEMRKKKREKERKREKWK